MKFRILICIFTAVLLLSGCGTKIDNDVSPNADSESAAAQSADIETSDTAPDAVSRATAIRYQENEIREYQGMRLDPAVGPRDNSIKGIQKVDIGKYMLSVTGLVENALIFTYDEVLKYPAYEKLINLHCVEGWDATILWKGVKISDILDEAGYGDAVKTVIFKSVDGYTTSMPLQTVLEREMIMAYEANNIVLPPSMGYPFIVVAEDKLGYKWARWVNEIELSDDENYKGYWESRGYTNEAEVP